MEYTLYEKISGIVMLVAFIWIWHSLVLGWGIAGLLLGWIPALVLGSFIGVLWPGTLILGLLVLAL